MRKILRIVLCLAVGAALGIGGWLIFPLFYTEVMFRTFAVASDPIDVKYNAEKLARYGDSEVIMRHLSARAAAFDYEHSCCLLEGILSHHRIDLLHIFFSCLVNNNLRDVVKRNIDLIRKASLQEKLIVSSWVSVGSITNIRVNLESIECDLIKAIEVTVGVSTNEEPASK